MAQAMEVKFLTLINLDRLFSANISESQTVEFKKASNSLPKSFWETYSSFANTKGGMIVLGVEEKDGDFKFVGVSKPEKMTGDIWNQLVNKNKVSHNLLSNEDINILEVEPGIRVITVDVPEAPLSKKPVYINGDLTKAFIRIGDGDRLLRDEELAIIMRNASPQMDSLLLDNFSISDLDPISVSYFKEKITYRYPDRGYEALTPVEFLVEIGAMRKNRNTETVSPLEKPVIFR